MALTESELRSSAVLEELRSNRGLFDGVIPNLPIPQSNRTSFALGSCQYPGGFVDEAVAYISYRDLAQRLDSDGGPRFVVLTGDQVYTDATAGILDPSMADGRYTLPYNRWLRSRAVRTALRQAHTFMLLDDHEIENDWEDSDADPVFAAAMRSYWQFQRAEFGSPDRRYFNFEFDEFRFFMLDTRTRRESRDLTNIDSADFLDGQGGGSQFDDLKAWLPGTPPTSADRPRFIVSPSMLLPRHREATRWGAPSSALHSDSWDGYPASLHQVLAEVAKSGTRVVFLSGDEHIGCIATITIKNLTDNTETTAYSIHTPGLYTPYTFANSGAMDWRPDTDHEFTAGGSDFEYTVSYTAYPGEGFAYINVEEAASGWHLSCQFSDGPVIPVL